MTELKDYADQLKDSYWLGGNPLLDGPLTQLGDAAVVLSKAMEEQEAIVRDFTLQHGTPKKLNAITKPKILARINALEKIAKAANRAVGALNDISNTTTSEWIEQTLLAMGMEAETVAEIVQGFKDDLKKSSPALETISDVIATHSDGKKSDIAVTPQMREDENKVADFFAGEGLPSKDEMEAMKPHFHNIDFARATLLMGFVGALIEENADVVKSATDKIKQLRTRWPELGQGEGMGTPGSQ